MPNEKTSYARGRTRHTYNRHNTPPPTRGATPQHANHVTCAPPSMSCAVKKTSTVSKFPTTLPHVVRATPSRKTTTRLPSETVFDCHLKRFPCRDWPTLSVREDASCRGAWWYSHNTQPEQTYHMRGNSPLNNPPTFTMLEFFPTGVVSSWKNLGIFGDQHPAPGMRLVHFKLLEQWSRTHERFFQI